MNTTPKWLLAAEEKPISFGISSSVDDLIPTMVIAIGPTARVVLDHVAYRLKTITATSDISFLALDVIPKSAQDTVTRGALSSEQVLFLAPDLVAMEKSVFTPAFRHVRWWWRGNRPESYGRAIGRLGVVSDLLSGTSGSTLFGKLSRGFSKPLTKVWVIASAADKVGTSVMYDVAMLARKAGGANISRLSLMMFMQDATTGREFDHSERVARVFASLAELERLGRNQPVQINYSSFDPQLRCEFQQSLFDDIFVANSQINSTIRPGQLNPVLIAMGDFLFSLLSPGFNRDFFSWLPHQPGSGRVLFTTIGTHSIRLPRKALLQVLKARLISELVKQIKQMLGGESAISVTRQQVINWLYGQGNDAPTDPLLFAIGKCVTDPVYSVGTPNALETLQLIKKTIPVRLANILNGEGIEFGNATGRLSLAVRFLEELDTIFELALRKFSDQTQRTIQDCRLIFHNLSKELKSCQSIWSASGVLTDANEHLKKVRAAYAEECKSGGAHTSVLDTKAEDDNFSNYFLVTNTVQESLMQKMLSYFGWYWDFDPIYQHDKIMLTLPLGGKRIMLNHNSSDQILNALEQLVDAFLLNVTNAITLDNELKKIFNRSRADFRSILSALVGKSTHTINYDMYKPSAMEYSSGVSVQKKTFLVSGDQHALQFVKQYITEVDSIAVQALLSGLQFSETVDSETVSMVQIVAQLPLDSMSIFKDEERDFYLPIDSGLHVFDAECLVSRARHMQTQLKSESLLPFDAESRALYANGEMVELFACSLVLGIIREEEGKLVFELEAGRKSVLFDSVDWYEGFKVFVSIWPKEERSGFGPVQRLKTIQVLDRNLLARRTEWFNLNRQTCEKIIDPLKKSSNEKHLELAWILDAVLNELKEQYGVK